MQINASFDSTVNNSASAAAYKAAVAAAIQYVQSAFVSNITINITFSYQGGGLASASTYTSKTDPTATLSAVSAITGSSAATTANASLPSSITSGQMSITDPLARQLGLSTSAQASDSTITLASSATWNWDPSVASVANGYGVFGTLVHEITEVMGRSCGSDGAFEYSPLTLFRYTAPGQLSTNGQAAGAYFSLDNGVTNLISMGNTGGDLADFNSTTDAFGTGVVGQPDQVSKIDLQETQAIGYKLSTGDQFGGGNSVTFAAANNNSALFADSGANWDVAYGSNGTVMLTNDTASVVGGDDTITFIAGLGTTRDVVSLYSTNGQADTVTGSGGGVLLNSAQANISGGGETLYFNGAGCVATLSNTSAWDLLNGSNGAVKLNGGAQVSILGGDDSVTLDGNKANAVSLYNTNNAADTLTGSNGFVILTKAQASISGGSETVYFDGATVDAVTLTATNGAWDLVNGANGAVTLTGGAQASVVGADDTINFSGTLANVVSLYNTATADTVKGSNGWAILNSAQASISGGGDTVYFDGATTDAATLSNTGGVWDTVYGANGTINLTGGAQASVVGSNDTVKFDASANNMVSLYNASSADTVQGSNGWIVLTNAQASVTGDKDYFGLSSGSSLTLSGTSERIQAMSNGGLSKVSGFVASDTVDLTLFSSKWTSFAAFQSSGAMTQSGSDTKIALGANNALTLAGVQASTLTAANFTFGGVS